MARILKIPLIVLMLFTSININAYEDKVVFNEIAYLELSPESDVDLAVTKMTDGKFIDYKRTPLSPKYTLDKLWVFLDLQATSHKNYIISSLFPLIEEFDVYELDKNGKYQQQVHQLTLNHAFEFSKDGKYLISMKSYNTLGLGFLVQTEREYYLSQIENKIMQIINQQIM